MKYVRITKRIFGMLSLTAAEAAGMISLLALYAVLEGFGIGLLLPVLEYLETGGDAIPSGAVWDFLSQVSRMLGIPITLASLLGFAFAPILLRQAVYYLITWNNAAIQNRAVERLMSRSFDAVATAELSYIESQDQGRLIGLVTGQAGRCGTALIQYVRLLSVILIISVYIVLLGIVSWPLTAIAIAATMVVSAAIRGILVSTRTQGRQNTQASLELSSAVRERLAAMRLVKMRAYEEQESKYVGELARTLKSTSTRIALAGARIEVIADPALMLAVFIIVYVGVTAFGLTLSGLGLFMFILLRLNAKVKEANVGRQALASMMPSFDFVESALAEAETAKTPPSGSVPFEGLKTGITFDNVWFSYRADSEPVLRGITLEIPRGSLTALVGRSGAGKSTMVDMIPLLRRPSSGTILFDGVPAQEYDLSSLRRHIGFLTQEPILFNDTIEANLTYGLDEPVSDEQMRRALEDSHCAEFIDTLPAGLQTSLGDRGVRFSGGQRQRLALARVLLASPDILLLDEPTSALDSESEAYIQQAFERIAEERTVIVIAHRLSTVERAHQIVVISDGAIVEQGTHSELIAEGGQYRRLFDQQIRA